MEFREAEERFSRLEAELAAGRISLEQYRAALNELRLTDGQGRLWMLQERTGLWHTWDGAQWIRATPPGTAPPAGAASPARVPAQEGGGCGKAILYVVGWAAIWLVIAGVVFALTREQGPGVLAGVGLAALFSLIWLLAQLSGAWQGVIVDIKRESVAVSDEDGTSHQEQDFAYIRQPNGRTRRMLAQRGWEVGDRVEKRRGEATVRAHKGGRA